MERMKLTLVADKPDEEMLEDAVRRFNMTEAPACPFAVGDIISIPDQHRAFVVRQRWYTPGSAREAPGWVLNLKKHQLL